MGITVKIVHGLALQTARHVHILTAHAVVLQVGLDQPVVMVFMLTLQYIFGKQAVSSKCVFLKCNMPFIKKVLYSIFKIYASWLLYFRFASIRI